MENRRLYSRAVRLLSRRGYSEEELREKLEPFASAGEVDEVLQECKRSNYLNDARLAELIAEKQLEKGKGYFFITSTLEKKGIPGDVIESIGKNFDFDREYAIAKDFFLKNRRSRKLASLLFSLRNRGFSFKTINKLMSTYVKRTEWTAEG